MEQGIDTVCRWLVEWIPYQSLKDYVFLQRALVALLLLGPLCSTIGIQIINFRMAFFSEAVGHSAFTGIALGYMAMLLLPAWLSDPLPVMVLFGVAIALGITHYRRRYHLASDTVIGVFQSSVIALGLFILTYLMQGHYLSSTVNLNNFLMGNVLTILPGEVMGLAIFFVLAMGFQAFAYNRLMLVGLNADLARSMGIRVAWLEYAFAALLALVVMFSIKAIGVLLVTAMLVIPAAGARNFARSAGSVFWWGILIATTSGAAGLIISDLYATAVGATTVLMTTAWFLFSTLIARLRG